MAAPRKPTTAGVRKKKHAAAASNGTARSVAGAPPLEAAVAMPEATPPADYGANGTSFAAIQRRAYEIYLQRGAGPGDELSDWLAAELELREKFAPSD